MTKVTTIEELERLLLAAVESYERKVIWPRNGGKRIQANYTRRMRRTYGSWREAAIRLLRTHKTSDGLHGLIAAGLVKLTWEWTMLDNAGMFPRDVAANAARNLALKGIEYPSGQRLQASEQRRLEDSACRSPA
jgi:hypothetical protein